MEKLLKQLFFYMFLNITVLHLWAHDDIGQLSSLPINATLHLQRNPRTKDLDYIYDLLFNITTVGSKKSLKADELYNRNLRNNDKQVNGPIFVQYSYNLSILETCEVNSTILKVEARDKNASLIKYSLWGPNSDYLYINQLSGVITLAEVLEYNRIKKYSVTVNAMDPKGYYSTVPVHLDIKDVDTMNPHFIFPMYNASISENQRGNLSTHPEEIKAIDGDIGINETIYYYISNVYPQEFRNVISINHADGVISLIREMDRECVSLITVQIKAVQQDNPLKSAESVVLITILDENDNPPTLSQSIYESYIAEDSPIGSNVLVLTASDKDKDGISKGYFTTNNTMFKVDKTGIMYFIHGELDRELTPEITVKVWVFDAESNGLNSSALVIINIIDVNDNNPEFHNLPLFFTIPEGNYTSTSPLLLCKVNATDPDEGANGQITITQTSDNGDKTFIVQQNGIIIVQEPLDRETKDRYPISLMASDSGTPPRKSIADLVIVIQDINDNVPTFTKHEYSAHLILSKVKEGDPFLTVCATDLDIGNNSQISYKFAQPLTGFTIDEDNGEISLTRNISAGSLETSIVLIVIATDHGVPALSSSSTVVVTITVGHAEFVHSNYSFSVLEDMPEGTEVGSVQTNAGPDLSVKYFLKTYTKIFSITDNGTIITCIMLDREEQDSYSIIVAAVDSQKPPNTAAVVVYITINDVNDNTPLFSPLIKTYVTCQENKNFLDFGVVSATDMDVETNGAVTYSLEKDFNGTFNINGFTGKLTNKKPLDAEKADSYDLKVIATDSGIPPLKSTIMIHVSVQDVDDNPPIFNTHLYYISVKENESPHVILNVSAVDMDTGNNAIILYSFTKVSHLFYIGKTSGNISILEPLDFETSAEHVMTVIAYNPSDPSRQCTATVIVHVEDVNEEGPIVEYPVYHTVIWDGLYPPGSLILDTNATKGNKAVDEGIHYSISGHNSEELFAIANATGHILLMKDLPVHLSPLRYALTVICTDNGAPPQSTSIKVFVTISPSNISLPVFSADYYIPEPLIDWTVPYTLLTQIKAFYLPSSLIYSMRTEKDKDYFIMDPLTGIIRTKNVLKIRDFPSNITVTATDSQRPWIYSEAIVHVTVVSGNQYAPVFPNSIVKVTVKEELSSPTFIAKVHANDGETDRSDLTYSILSDHSQSFSINAKDGMIFTSITFDFENGPNEFQIFILAEDHGIPHKKQGYCIVVVHVLDINDCKPVFAPSDYIIVGENVPVGTVVGQITATDGDSGDNVFIVYSLFVVQGLSAYLRIDEDDQYEIDGLLGNIVVKNHLDYETKQISLLTITATNNKTAPFYQTRTQLTIHLFDENDNAPQFTQKQYFVEIDVNSPVGSHVLVVNATDRDQGDNGVIEYFLMSCEYFLFENKRDGKIITGKRLEPGEINVTVFAKDRGFPSLNNNATVTVNVVNKDHSLPVFSPQEVSTVLKKNKDRNGPVYIFSALGQNIIYRIVAGNDRGQFNLNEKTGELRTTKTFNYGMQPSYTITVEAERTPELQGPLPMNFAQLKIIVPDFHAGPLFEKQRYAARILNSMPSGFSVIRVTAKDQDLRLNETLIYSLVNQSGEEFVIDKYTGQILFGSVTGKTGIFHFKVQATDPNGLSDQTVVQIKVQSSSSSNDVAEIKINQTLNEVEPHISKIVRILEDTLQQNVTLLHLGSDSKNKQDTDIQFQTVGKSNQDIDRFLKDNTQSIQKILDSVFEKPVGISISQPQKFIMSQGTIASIVITVLLGCILLVSAVLVLTRKTSHKTFWKTSSESTEKIDSEEGNGGSACSVLTKDKGNVAAAKMTQDHQQLHRVIKTQEQADGNDSPKKNIEAQLSEPQMVQTVSEKDTMKEQLPKFIQETQVEYVVTWESYESEDDSGTDLTRKDGAEYKAPSTPDIVTLQEDAEQTENKHDEMTSAVTVVDEDNVAAAKMTQDHQKLHRVIKTQEQADGNDSPKKYIEAQLSEPQMVQTVSEKDTMKEQLPKFIQETQVEYVVTWESYESEDDSGTDLTRKDGAEYKAPSTPDIVTLQEDAEQTENKDDEMTSAVTVVDEDNVAAAKMTQDHQKLHRVIKTQEQADGNDSPKKYIEAQLSEPQMVQTVSEKDTMKEQLPNFVQETQVEYVVTWESYESEDDSGTDLTRKDGAEYKTPSTPDIVTLQEDAEQTENKDDKMTSTVTVVNEE